MDQPERVGRFGRPVRLDVRRTGRQPASDFGASPGAEIQRAFADVNGDGLPDSVYTTAEGVFAFYNLGYGFTGHAVKLGGGGFESRESATGGGGLGFSLPYGEFGGGVNLLFNYDWSTYSWRDVNGDGILDQLRRASTDSIKVRFGTGSGLLPEVDYGNLNEVAVSPGIDGGEQIHFDRSSGIGGGVSATAYIGPLCLVACYLVIGGGGGFNQSRSSSSVDLEDVNGDGFADSLLSLNDDQLTVALNTAGPVQPPQDGHQPARRVVHRRLRTQGQHRRPSRFDLGDEAGRHRRRTVLDG